MTKEEYIILKAAKEAEYAAMCQKVIDGINAEDFFPDTVKQAIIQSFQAETKKQSNSLGLGVDWWQKHEVFHLLLNYFVKEKNDKIDFELARLKWEKIADHVRPDLCLYQKLSINRLCNYVDSDPVEFDGDIVITDPCYIMKNPDLSTMPKWEDFHPYNFMSDYPDYDAEHDCSKLFMENSKKLHAATDVWNKEHPDDWELCDYGDNMDVLGFTSFMTRGTIYGDWSCTVFDLDTNKEIGRFMADAGMVCVVLKDEIQKYNPEYTNFQHDTVIPNFKGTVKFVVKEEEYVLAEDQRYYPYKKAGEKEVEHSVHVVGHGINKLTGEPINFYSIQTGL